MFSKNFVSQRVHTNNLHEEYKHHSYKQIHRNVLHFFRRDALKGELVKKSTKKPRPSFFADGNTAAFKVRELRRAPGSLRRAGLQALPLRVLPGGGAAHRCPSRLLLARGLLASVHMSFP